MTYTKRFVSSVGILSMLAMGGTALAQTTTPTDTTTTTTSTPGVPNTGAGGDTAMNLALLGASGLVALGGAAYLARKKVMTH